MQAVLGKSGVMKYRGQEIVLNSGIKVLPTVHPASVLRNPKNKELFFSDVEKASSLSDGSLVPNENVSINIVRTKDDLRMAIEAIRKAPRISFDLETWSTDTDPETGRGFNMYLKEDSVILSMAIATSPTVAWVFPMYHPKYSPFRRSWYSILQTVKPYLVGSPKDNPTRPKNVGQNFKFDSKWVKVKGGFSVYQDDDAMLISHCLDENTPNGLKHLAAVYCGAPNYDHDILPLLKKGIKTTKAEYDKILVYNGWDVIYNLQLYPILSKKLKKEPRMWNIYRKIYMPASRMYVDVEIEGMYIRPERLNETRSYVQGKFEAAEKKLRTYLPKGYEEKYCWEYLKTKVKPHNFNWNSPKQLVGLMFTNPEGLRLPVIEVENKKKKSTNPSTAEAVLLEMKHPISVDLLDYRNWAKFMSTYINAWSSKVDENNRLHPVYKLHGTVTGRLSAQHGVHQVPRDPVIRSLIGAPPGWRFVEADFKQIELKIVGHVADEREMKHCFNTGVDIHTKTAATVAMKLMEEVTKDDRKKAKAVNFGFVYGMGWRKFRQYAKEKYGIDLTERESKETRKIFFQLYRDLPIWHDRQRRIAQKLGYVVAPNGRIRHLPDIYSDDEGVVAEAERQAINSPIQGFGSDLTQVGLIRIHKKAIWDEIRVVGSLHDAGLFIVKEDKLDKWLPIIKSTMEDMTIQKKWFNCELTVPIEVDVKVGDSWGEAKEVEVKNNGNSST